MGEAVNDLRTLKYVAEIVRRLAKMLSRTRYQMLVYFLEMTAVEADSLAAEQDRDRHDENKAPATDAGCSPRFRKPATQRRNMPRGPTAAP
ncbi:MAG: hypothetical protein EOR68_12295 [Mesorhizobium sp.]|uniref:hypothetical protein n=1 Tax=Mesorhizobium sp. TaxID=1871066 RepID=UPI000FE943E4|nr:hypothetical protein [Mesorhizobium sp.]RWL99829.1 MAG: hypothetical protein EOR68_12295 [Mesorhizobium sp.]TIP49255.1 MAG: hypothetical protein E5X77_11850 [Mesorhizobium sp.]